MHGFPDGASLGIILCQCLQDLHGTALSWFRDVQGFLFPAHLPAHGFRIDDQAGQPVVGLGMLRIKRIHLYRKVLKALPVPLINGLLLCDVLL